MKNSSSLDFWKSAKERVPCWASLAAACLLRRLKCLNVVACVFVRDRESVLEVSVCVRERVCASKCECVRESVCLRMRAYILSHMFTGEREREGLA